MDLESFIKETLVQISKGEALQITSLPQKEKTKMEQTCQSYSYCHRERSRI